MGLYFNLFLLLIFIDSITCFEVFGTQQYWSDVLSKNMTLILDLITDTEKYDKRLRPYYGGPPVDVFINMHVTKLGAVSELNMDFTLDIDIRQNWIDPRLRWKDMPITEIRIFDTEYMKSIWVPDTYFPTEKRAAFHHTTVNQIFLDITNTGNITTRQNGYTIDDIRLFWLPDVDTPVKLQEEIKLATFELGPLEFEDGVFNLSTGSYSRLYCSFKFDRVLRYYWIQIYQPSILVVMVSWVAFWISRDSAPARVTLGITTVLTMTTLMSSTNQQMPKVSYVKAMDIYLLVCYIMVFAALIEYAVVSYSNKKKQDLNKKKLSTTSTPKMSTVKRESVAAISLTSASTPSQMGASLTESMAGGAKQPDLVFHTIKQSPSISRPTDVGGAFPVVDAFGIDDVMPRIELNRVVSFKKIRGPKRVKDFNDRVKGIASGVDKYSRILFPAVFTVFNLIYWLYYLHASGKLENM